jgi:excisionase family DNA binding protein
MSRSTSDLKPWLTTGQVAQQLAVAAEKVLAWIRQGELRAVNVAERVSAKPRWRISPEALDEFLLRRQSTAPSPVRRMPSNQPAADGRGKVVRASDGRLVKNVADEVRVKRLASIIASRRGGWGADWLPLLDEAIERYAQKNGVRVSRDAVLSREGLLPDAEAASD